MYRAAGQGIYIYIIMFYLFLVEEDGMDRLDWAGSVT
jgi:drug/metabolite transporter superfamily protein YnfA